MNHTIRKRIYRIAVGILAIATAIGLVTADESPLILALVDSVIGVGIAVMALRNLNEDTWAAFRMAVYTLMATAGPVLAIYGYTVDARWPTAIQQALTIAGGLIASRKVTP